MRRQLNLKALLILLLSVVVLGVAAFSLHAYQMRRNAHSLQEQSQREEEEGHLDKALRYLEAYLRMRPSDTEAWERYGLLVSRSPERLADPQGVFMALERVLWRAPARHDLRRKVVEIALTAAPYRPNDALKHLDLLAGSFPNDPQLCEQRGQAEEQLKNFEKAAQAYAQAVRLDPKRIDWFLKRAQLLQRHLRNAEAADEVIKEMMKANQDSLQAKLAKVRYQKEYKDEVAREDACITLEQMIEKLEADNPDVRLLAADMELTRSKPDALAERIALEAARKHLRHGLENEKNRKDFRYYLALARVEMSFDRRKEAQELLREGLAQLPDEIGTISTAADLLLDLGVSQDAKDLIAKIPRNETSAGILDYLEARVQMANQKWARALELLKKAPQAFATMPEYLKQAWLLTAECHRRLGHPEQQLAAARAALEVDAFYLPAQLSRASALQALGRLDEAANLYAALADRIPEARLSAIRLGLEWNRQQKHKNLQDWAKVNKQLEQAERVMGERPEIRLARVQILAAQGDLDKAWQAAKKACEDLPHESSLWIAWAELAVLQKHPELVPDILNKAKAKEAAGDCAAIRLAWLWHYETAGNLQEASAFAKANAAPMSETTEESAWQRGLAGFYLRTQDWEAARQTLTHLAELAPEDLTVRLALLEVLSAKHDGEGMRDLVAYLLDKEGDEGTLWRYAEAVRLMTGVEAPAPDKRDRARAHQLLNEIGKRRPAWAPSVALQGAIEEMEGNAQRAIVCYQRAVELGDNRPVLMRRLVELYYQQHRYAEAQKVLEASHFTLEPGELGRLATQVSVLVNQDPKLTLALAQAAVDPKSLNYKDHLWRAQVLMALQRNKPSDTNLEQTRTALEQAIKLGGDHGETWVMLVQFLAGGGHTKEAKEKIAEAALKLPADAAPLALAACYETIGDRASATEQYAKALAARPGDPAVHQAKSLFHLRGGEADQAAFHLIKIIESRKSPPAQVAWARRTLAVMLASSGDYQRSTEALKLLEQNAGDEQASPEDRRVMALIQARRPGGRREAIRNLKASFELVPPTDDERFLLAYLHAANHDWDQAEQQFLHVVGGATRNLGYLAVYVHLLIEQGKLDAAEQWLRLLRDDPDVLRTAGLQARLYHALKKDKDAVAVLQKCAAERPEDTARQLAVSTLLDQLGYAAEAEKLLRAVVQDRGKDQPTVVVPLIRFLGRQNQLTEALKLCEELRGKVPDEAMVHVWVGCLRSGRPEEKHCARVEKWITEAQMKQPASTLFELALANLLDLQNRHEEAEEIYRNLLSRDENNLLARNNLAALLAFHRAKAEDALALIDGAIAKAGPLPTFLDTRAIVHMARDQWAEAARDLEEVVSMEPNPASFLRLARAHLRAGDRPEARKDLKKARAGGLRMSDFHPLERPVYEQVQRDLEPNPPQNAP
jgi:tetratricopeptide (TPR) repeat protein